MLVFLNITAIFIVFRVFYTNTALHNQDADPSTKSHLPDDQADHKLCIVIMDTRLSYYTFIVLVSFCVVIITLIYNSESRSVQSRRFTSVRPLQALTHRNTTIKTDTVLSKLLVVRRAYFDKRKRRGNKNAVVFMLEMARLSEPNIFVGCRVGSAESSKVYFRRSKQYQWAIRSKHVTKNVAFLDCFNLDGVKDGDAAYIKICRDTEGDVEVRSQRNVIVPQSRKDLILSHPSVVACVATVRVGEIPPSEDGMLYQWLRYQKTIGVDHVHIIAEDTFAESGGFKHPITQDALKENFLSIDFWPRWFNTTEIYHSSQHLAYNDCLYRFQGVYDYGLFSDLDDFFVPIGESKSIKTYLRRWCSGKIVSCKFKWHQYYPECGWSPESVGTDGNLTATLHSQKNVLKRDSKTAHQLRAVVEVGIHTSMARLPRYNPPTFVPFQEAHFAHLRKQSYPPGGC